jgi:hypothetical protein
MTSPLAPSRDAGRPLDIEVARDAVMLMCAACRSGVDVRLEDGADDFGFCGGCLDSARRPVLDVELGGEC